MKHCPHCGEKMRTEFIDRPLHDAALRERDEARKWVLRWQAHCEDLQMRLVEALELIKANANQTMLMVPHSEDYCRGANAGFRSQAEIADAALSDFAKVTPADHPDFTPGVDVPGHSPAHVEPFPKPVRKEITHEEYMDAIKNSKARWP